MTKTEDELIDQCLHMMGQLIQEERDTTIQNIQLEIKQHEDILRSIDGSVFPTAKEHQKAMNVRLEFEARLLELRRKLQDFGDDHQS